MKLAPPVAKPLPTPKGKPLRRAPAPVRARVPDEPSESASELDSNTHESLARSHNPSLGASSPPSKPTHIASRIVVAAAHDPLEHEADAIADRVMRMSVPHDAATPRTHSAETPWANTLRRACKACCDACEDDDEPLRREPAAGQRGGIASEAFAARLDARTRLGGSPLTPDARAFLEPRLRAGLDRVRTHTDASADSLAHNVGARAFTVGQHIFFAAGELQPRASAGMRLLAHEVAHTLQGPGRASLRRTPESEAVDAVDTGDDLLAQSKSIQSAVDSIRADLERVLVDLASSELEGYAVPETLRKRTVSAKTRYRKITRALEARSTLESVLMIQWLDAALEVIALLRQCVKYVAEHDEALRDSVEANYGEPLRRLSSSAKQLRRHPFFQQAEARVATTPEPVSQTEIGDGDQVSIDPALELEAAYLQASQSALEDGYSEDSGLEMSTTLTGHAASDTILESLARGYAPDLSDLSQGELLEVEQQLRGFAEHAPGSSAALLEYLDASVVPLLRSFAQRQNEGKRRAQARGSERARQLRVSGVLLEIELGWDRGESANLDLAALSHAELVELELQIRARLADPLARVHAEDLRALLDGAVTPWLDAGRTQHLEQTRTRQQGVVAAFLDVHDDELDAARHDFSVEVSRAELTRPAYERAPLDLENLETALAGRLSIVELDLALQRLDDAMMLAETPAELRRMQVVRDHVYALLEGQQLVGDYEAPRGLTQFVDVGSRVLFDADLYELQRRTYARAREQFTTSQFAESQPELFDSIWDAYELLQSARMMLDDGSAFAPPHEIPSEHAYVSSQLEPALETLDEREASLFAEDLWSPPEIRSWALAAKALVIPYRELTQYAGYAPDEAPRSSLRACRTRLDAILGHELIVIAGAVEALESGKLDREERIDHTVAALLQRGRNNRRRYRKIQADKNLGYLEAGAIANMLIARVPAADLPRVFSAARNEDPEIFELLLFRGVTVQILQERHGVAHLLDYVAVADVLTMVALAENEGLLLSGTSEMDYSVSEVLEAGASFLAALPGAFVDAIAKAAKDLADLLLLDTWKKLWEQVETLVSTTIPRIVEDERFRVDLAKALGGASATILADIRRMSPEKFGKTLAKTVAPLLLEILIAVALGGGTQATKFQRAVRAMENPGGLDASIENLADRLSTGFGRALQRLGHADLPEDRTGIAARVTRLSERIDELLAYVPSLTNEGRWQAEAARLRGGDKAHLRRLQGDLDDLIADHESGQISTKEFGIQLQRLELETEVATQPQAGPALRFDESLESGEVRVEYDAVDGVVVPNSVRVVAAPDASPRWIKLHGVTAEAIRKHSGLQGEIRKLLTEVGDDPRAVAGTARWEAKFEVEKLESHVDSELELLRQATPGTKQADEAQETLEALSWQFEHWSRVADGEISPGDARGFIAAKKQRGIWDPEKTGKSKSTPGGWRTTEKHFIEGGPPPALAGASLDGGGVGTMPDGRGDGNALLNEAEDGGGGQLPHSKGTADLPVLFENELASQLEVELEDALRVGAKPPIRAGGPGFEDMVNEGDIKFIVDQSGELWVMPKFVNEREITHAVLSGGKPVLAAGEASIAGGKKKFFGLWITRHSGHFKPSADSLMIARDAFARIGVIFPE